MQKSVDYLLLFSLVCERYFWLDFFFFWWVCWFLGFEVFFFIKMWSKTLLSSTTVLKVSDWNSFALCSFRHKLCLVKPDICRESWRIVSWAKLLFVLFYVCRMKRWCLTALLSLLQGWWILLNSHQWKLM